PRMTVCATRWCAGKLGILLGTWAIEGPVGDTNNDEVPLGPRNGAPTPIAGANKGFRGAVQKLFNANRKGYASRVASFVSQIAQEPPPYNENTFYMSFRGNESQYAEN